MKKTKLKTPKPIDCSNCKHKCTINFNEELRNKICASFWKLNYERQKDFILSNVKMKLPKKRRPKFKDNPEIKRTNTKLFSLCDKRVCQAFFLKTLSISNGPLIQSFKQKSEFANFFDGSDQRGRHVPGNKLKQEIIDSIINFLNNKCIKESDARFKKKIINDLEFRSIRMLYNEYKRLNENLACPSLTTFKKIFNDNNFSFPQERLRHKPAISQKESEKKINILEIVNLDVSENAMSENLNNDNNVPISEEPMIVLTQVPDKDNDNNVTISEEPMIVLTQVPDKDNDNNVTISEEPMILLTQVSDNNFHQEDQQQPAQLYEVQFVVINDN